MPHGDDAKGANRKAAFMVEEALARVRMSPPVDTVMVAPHRALLVIGATFGGVVGANWATRLGYRVFILSKATNMEAIRTELIENQPVLTDFQMNPLGEFILGADVEHAAGWCGDYTVTVVQDGQSRKLTVGGILVAIGDDRVWAARLTRSPAVWPWTCAC